MTLIGLKQLQARVPKSRTWFWRMERAGRFPRRRQIGTNSVAWVAEEIDEWMGALGTESARSISVRPTRARMVAK
jgi:predicted DNA-binding transcriptional regulator AlpA